MSSQRRKLRARAKKKYGYFLLKHQGYRCYYCRTVIVLTFDMAPQVGSRPPSWQATIEHIKPLSEGGTNRLSNLALTCYDCNQKRNTQRQKEINSEKVRAQDNSGTATRSE